MSEGLTPEQALQNVDNAVAMLQLSRRDHFLLQQSVSCLRDSLVRLAKLQQDSETERTIDAKAKVDQIVRR